jgi:hypothetical protein
MSNHGGNMSDSPNTTLDDVLTHAKESIQSIYDAVEEQMKFAPNTDEYLEDTVEYWGLTALRGSSKNRYLLVRPDGKIYMDVPLPGRGPLVTFSQRPAALRAARNYPGCRVYDVHTRTFVTEA